MAKPRTNPRAKAMAEFLRTSNDGELWMFTIKSVLGKSADPNIRPRQNICIRPLIVLDNPDPSYGQGAQIIQGPAALFDQRVRSRKGFDNPEMLATAIVDESDAATILIF